MGRYGVAHVRVGWAYLNHLGRQEGLDEGGWERVHARTSCSASCSLIKLTSAAKAAPCDGWGMAWLKPCPFRGGCGFGWSAQGGLRKAG